MEELGILQHREREQCAALKLGSRETMQDQMERKTMV